MLFVLFLIFNNVFLGTDVVCGSTLSELIDLLSLPDSLSSLVATARGWVCNSV